MPDLDYDLALVGGGIVGLATALRVLERRPETRLVVLEKEDAVATHQSSRNSGVVHAGVYYRPGSRKARLCAAGRADLEALAREHSLPVRRCGKTIVALSPAELPRLLELERRARANGLDVHRLDADGLAEHEPHAAALDGPLTALWIPATGIADFGAVARTLADLVRARGGEIRTGVTVQGGAEDADGVTLRTDAETLRARAFVACAGLHADRLARGFGLTPTVQLVPFRGEYARVGGDSEGLVRGLIYPVPDPAFPFLGVHLTRTIHGRVEAGPSAALAFAREGYRLRDVRLRDLGETLAWPGFRRLAARHVRMGAAELGRSLSLSTFWRAARRLVPALARADLTRGPAGVRAQAVLSDGSLADDFVIETTPRAVHVLNAPSPAATASLAIGAEIAGDVVARLA